MGRQIIDLTGQKFGRLTVLKRDTSVLKGNSYWFCQCECGNEKRVKNSHLKDGNIKSCGCYQKEKLSKRVTKHGKYKSKEYNSWDSMKSRCLNDNNKDYHNYGGRGISICERWLGENGFQNFLEDMGERPNLDYSLERINVNGNYEPSNCKWATRKEQQRNQRFNIIKNESDAETIRKMVALGMNKKEISEEFKCSITTIYDIINNKSWNKDNK